MPRDLLGLAESFVRRDEKYTAGATQRMSEGQQVKEQNGSV